ncbi:TetR family transcriptional regulator [Saccharothrix sp. NRRL B-16348]|uniref:TetR/AcrR family transcriptional regulator n=1 Tax=Saccharothrix sp. NRRL B-16348 TaxID=1415542 RepID=UPI0006B0388A|nr:TetR/AcrR family transcriptional regulator [Saccharothrix sp. NRRL B-16348]KOX17436.1 TetR family transcriptional regulator [Saccharothrix sp. NRRL B-16348]
MTSRPGGRSARVREAVLEAVHAELTEHGYAGMTVENVAERAGVHKTTVYRRWGTVDVLIADALDHSRETGWPVPDTGTVEGDLIAIATEVADTFADPERRLVPIAIVAAALQSTRALDAKGRFYAARHAEAAQVVTRAVARGELPPQNDPVELVRLTCAPLYHRIFITGEPVDRATAALAALAALAAARAGLL